MAAGIRLPGAIDDDDELKAEDDSSLPKSKKSRTISQKSAKRKGNTRPSKENQAKRHKKSTTAVQDTRNEMIVGIDLGTTFSGIAYSNSRSLDNQRINVITEWPSGARNNDVLEKVPSCIAFRSENEGLLRNLWGYEVETDMRSCTWFKLFLDKHTRQTYFDDGYHPDRDSEGILKLPKGMTGQTVTREFLKCLYEYLMPKLEKTLTVEGLRKTPIQFWFTSPATWSDKANTLTQKAARYAGFGSRVGDRISMITEPEAAATAILATKVDEQPDLFEAGQSGLVVDIGGGTTDLSLLTLEKIEPLKLSEAVPGIMGKHGSTTIYRMAVKMLGDELGPAFRDLPQTKIGPGSRFHDEFERMQKNFDASKLQKIFSLQLTALGHRLRLAGLETERYDFEEGYVLIKGTEMAEWFDKVVDNAIELANQQISALREAENRTPNFIMLCGGLANSHYVWTRFEEYCAEEHHGNISLQTDDRAWSAVVRGAVIRGLEGSKVVSRNSRHWYGIELHRKFEEGVDNEDESFVCPLKGKRAPKYFDFHVRKGERYSDRLLKKIKVYVPISKHDDPIFEWELFQSDQDAMPRRVDDEGVVKVGTIEVNLSGANADITKKRKTSTGSASSWTHEAVVSLNLTYGSTTGTLQVQAMHDRKKVGVTTFKHDAFERHRPTQPVNNR